jgi:hypothetical protein
MDLADRVDCGRNYFKALVEWRHVEWNTLYDRFIAGELTLPQSATLIHPLHREHVDETPRRRRRIFDFVPPEYERCHADDVWGYVCTTGDRLEIDHRFPYAFGGPTCSENALYLCRMHNQAKGHDIHMLSWTEDYFSWLPDEIEAVRMLLGA